MSYIRLNFADEILEMLDHRFRIYVLRCATQLSELTLEFDDLLKGCWRMPVEYSLVITFARTGHQRVGEKPVAYDRKISGYPTA